MIISMKNYYESFSEKLLMKRITQIKRLWSTNIQRYWVQFFFCFFGTGRFQDARRASLQQCLSAVCFWGLLHAGAVSYRSRILALSSSASDARRLKRWKWTGCYRKWRDGHQACRLLVGFDLLDLLGGGMCHWKEDGILTSTLNTFRKKLLCRCLVLVFTTVRFQSAMLGKCFSLS